MKNDLTDYGKPSLTPAQRKLRNYAAVAGVFILFTYVLRVDAFSFDWWALGSLVIGIMALILQYADKFSRKLDEIADFEERTEKRLNNVESYLRYGKRGKFEKVD
jgi:hypothetical protein